MRRMNRIAIAIVLACSFGGCAAVADEMRRAEASYEQARYQNTLIWLTDLEDDAPGMDQEMRVRYFYLRGMTEYRLGHRQNALHYLAVAREIAGDQGAGLPAQWRQIMDTTLTELTPRGRMNHRPPDPGETSGGEGSAEEEENEAPPPAET